MNIKRILGNNTNVIAVAIPILIILFPLCYSAVDYVVSLGTEPPPPLLERPDEKYKECVRETGYMRFHHWELLREVREEVVRYGKRGELGLYNCRECHTSRERFCNECHDAASVWLDCFGCHYYP